LSVVGHEDAGIASIGLGVDVTVFPIGGGQERRLGLHPVFVRDAGGNVGGKQLLAVGPRAVQRVLQGQGKRGSGRGRLGKRTTSQGQCQYRQYAQHQLLQYEMLHMNGR
jgi:hypothetical protein